MVNTFIPTDDCCDKYLAKAIASGKLDNEKRWECPICGMEWRVGHRYETIRHWVPMPVVEVIR